MHLSSEDEAVAVRMQFLTPTRHRMPSSGSLHETSRDRFKMLLHCTNNSTEDSVMHRHNAACP